MFAIGSSRRFSSRQAAASLLVHAALVVAVTRVHGASTVRVLTQPGTTAGTRIELTYKPGRTPAPASRAASQNLPTLPAKERAQVEPGQDLPLALAMPELPRPHLPPLRQTSVALNSNPSVDFNTTAGSDDLGLGDVQIALTAYSPSPHPDLSGLPHGAQGDLIIDVTIDPEGKVADLQVLQALGYGIESDVMATLRTWKFHPALKGGVAVASVQELHFHFGPA